MDKKEYKAELVKVEKVYKQKGQMEIDGRTIEWNNYYIEFTIGEYPLIFKAKIDKALKEYLEVAYESEDK